MTPARIARRIRQHVGDWSDTVKDNFIIVLVAIVLGSWTVGGLIVINAVTSHSTEIHKIYVLQKQDNRLQKHDNELTQQANALKAAYNKGITEVAGYAAQLSAELAAFHGTSFADQQAICAAIPGCHLPTASTSP